MQQYMLLPYPGPPCCARLVVSLGAWDTTCRCLLLCIPAPLCLIRGCIGKHKGDWGMCWGQRRVSDALLPVTKPTNVLVTASSLQLSMPNAQLSDRRGLTAAVFLPLWQLAAHRPRHMLGPVGVRSRRRAVMCSPSMRGIVCTVCLDIWMASVSSSGT